MSRSSQRGFSVLELLIAVTIIGLLASVAMPRMMCEVRKAKLAAAEVSIRAAQSDIEAYRVSTGRLPESLTEVYPEGGTPPGFTYSRSSSAPETSGSLRRQPAPPPPAPTEGGAGGYLLTYGTHLCPGCGVNVDHLRAKGFAEGFGPVNRAGAPIIATGNPGDPGDDDSDGPPPLPAAISCPGNPKCPGVP